MSEFKDAGASALGSKVIGWREWIALPELGLTKLRAKVDTGARTSALHAADLEFVKIDGVEHVRFVLPFEGNRELSCPVQGRRRVRNTGGVPETRIIIRTDMILGTASWPIDIALSNRDKMLNPIILGRTSIRGRKLTVNPGRSFLLGSPDLKGDVK